MVNETQTVGFSSKPRLYEPTAEIGSGQLMVQMRLAQGKVDFIKNLVLLLQDCTLSVWAMPLSNGTLLLQIHHTSSSTNQKIIQL